MDKLTEDEYFHAVGQIIHLCTEAENAMFAAFAFLAHCDRELARAIFYTLDSFPGRRTLLRRTATIVCDAKQKKLVERIIEGAEKANNQRREVAHVNIVPNTQDGVVQVRFKDLNGHERESSIRRPISRRRLDQLILDTIGATAFATEALTELWHTGLPPKKNEHEMTRGAKAPPRQRALHRKLRAVLARSK